MQFCKADADPLRQHSNATTQFQHLVFEVWVYIYKIKTLRITQNVIETGYIDSLGTVLGTQRT